LIGVEASNLLHKMEAMKESSPFTRLALIKRGLSHDEAAYMVGVGTPLFDKRTRALGQGPA
jgi:hypothetical protein